MAVTNIDLLIARASSFQATLATIDNQTKNRHVTKQLANNFNRLLDEIKKEMPADTASHLPPPITFVSNAAKVAGMSDVLYLDLEIMINEIMNILGVLKAGQ